jgi:hypothetical protein
MVLPAQNVQIDMLSFSRPGSIMLNNSQFKNDYLSVNSHLKMESLRAKSPFGTISPTQQKKNPEFNSQSPPKLNSKTTLDTPMSRRY